MKSYIVFLFQTIVWSGYTLAEWLSNHDRIVYKITMFIIFCYLALIIGKTILKSNKRTLIITCTSLVCHGLITLCLHSFVPVRV
ncbi:hypothetical protein CUU66_20845 [Peribacillus deserti]|uniref:Uncharacterized protein n=1 Tax=Peribacillus deserti TaxID=673318 RepID=A0A2N5M0Z9_9BACI|nr:hypothetical protein CUU66_20845 [Peribacillus deserti]